jgi:hypothetical protein
VWGAALLQSVNAGFEVGPRVGLALRGLEMLSWGWHSGAVFGTHPAAAAWACCRDWTSRVRERVGPFSRADAMSKRMRHGFAAPAGLYAAWLTADGYASIKRVDEHDYGGFLSVMGEGHQPDPSQPSKGLGEHWDGGYRGGALTSCLAAAPVAGEQPWRAKAILLQPHGCKR